MYMYIYNVHVHIHVPVHYIITVFSELTNIDHVNTMNIHVLILRTCLQTQMNPQLHYH